jgi:hypothetical protein
MTTNRSSAIWALARPLDEFNKIQSVSEVFTGHGNRTLQLISRMFNPSQALAFERSPKLIVDDLERTFQMAEAPKSLAVCSSSVKTDDGLKHIQIWFNAKKGLANRPI